MCGRYFVDEDEGAEELREIICEINRRGACVKVGEVRPTDMAAVVTSGGPRAMRWGFPSPSGSGVVINARAETARDKPMFRAARRLVVPVSGFYEWKRLGRTRVKYLFRVPGEGITYLAGLLGAFSVDQTVQERFVILTMDASGAVASYHDRMPLKLAAEDVERWLSGQDVAPEKPDWAAEQAEDEEQLSFL